MSAVGRLTIHSTGVGALRRPASASARATPSQYLPCLISEDILRDIKEASTSYGVAIFRADVKDIVFPGNLFESQVHAESQRAAAEARSLAQRMEAEAAAEVQRIKTQAEIDSLKQRETTATAYELQT